MVLVLAYNTNMKIISAILLHIVLVLFITKADGYQSCPYAYPCNCEICLRPTCIIYPCGTSCSWGGGCTVDFCTSCGDPPIPYPCNCAVCTGYYCDCPGHIGCVCFGAGGFCTPCVTPFECILGADGPICINQYCIFCPCPNSPYA